MYCWAPQEDPFDGEEASIWSLNYFFFNKDLKRVAYIYVRGVPVMTQSPRIRAGLSKRGASGYDSGSSKRAKYWFPSDKVANLEANDEEVDMDDDATMWNNDNELDEGDALFDGDDFCDDYDDEADDESDQGWKEPVRGVSEDIAARMDIDH